MIWSANMSVVSRLECDCGCLFVNGGAVRLCEEAIIKDGVLYHGIEPPGRNCLRLSEEDKKFLALAMVKVSE